MDFKTFSAGINDDNRRIDKVIRSFAENLSLSQIYKALRKGLIKLNDKKAQPDAKVHTDDSISIAAFLLNDENKASSNTTSKTENSLPPVVFKNEHLIFFNKPENLNVQGKNSLADSVASWYAENNSDTSLSFKTGPLHRIDRNTTGLITFSLSLKGAQWFSENIREHVITKKYRAIVEGELGGCEVWEDFIEKQEANTEGFHKVEVKADNSGAAKAAYTKVTPLSHGFFKNKPVTYVEFEIKTGRQHQIRAQSAAHNFPLLGDTAYNNNSVFNHFFLHAYELSFPEDNPLQLPEKITAELPKNFKDFLDKYF